MDKDQLQALYDNENFEEKFKMSKHHIVPICFDSGTFGEFLACIVFNTKGIGTASNWDTVCKREVKTGTTIPVILSPSKSKSGGERWGISPKDHKKYKNEQNEYVLIYIEFLEDAQSIRTTIGTIPPKNPILESQMEIALTGGNTNNYTINGQKVFDLPIKIETQILYNYVSKELTINEEHNGRTDYFGKPTGKVFKTGRPRGIVKRL